MIAVPRPDRRQPLHDNGSTDGAPVCLAGVQDSAAVPLTVVSNATNLGFSAAISTKGCIAHAANASCCSTRPTVGPESGVEDPRPTTENRRLD